LEYRKAEPKVDLRVDLKAEPKVDLMVHSKVEPTVQHSVVYSAQN
jgi:hypothetical protein